MRQTLLLTALVLPAPAWADCVYTGAKRAYIDCIYNEALTATSDLASLALDVLGLGDRVDAAESNVAALQAADGELADRLDTTDDDLLYFAGLLVGPDHVTERDPPPATGLTARVGELTTDIGALQDAFTDLDVEVDGLTTRSRKDFWRGEMSPAQAATVVNASTADAQFTLLYNHADSDVISYDDATHELVFAEAGLATIDMSIGMKCYKPAGPGPAAYARTLIYRNGVRILSTLGGDLEGFWSSIENHLMLEIAAGDRLRFSLQCNDGVFTSVDSGDRSTVMARWEPW